MSKIENGTVKWFNSQKGYGFVQGDDGVDVFVHYSSIQTGGYKELKEGQRVQYSVIKGQKGMQAEDVKILQ